MNPLDLGIIEITTHEGVRMMANTRLMKASHLLGRDEAHSKAMGEVDMGLGLARCMGLTTLGGKTERMGKFLL